jgi:hypothetical protein
MRLLEQLSGIGELLQGNEVLQEAHYKIRIYQKVQDAESDQPKPDSVRIEGTLDSELLRDPLGIVGAELTLRLMDGRCVPITVLDHRGRISGREYPAVASAKRSPGT